MTAVRKTFSDRKLSPFVFQDSYAKILSGEEEGVFGYVRRCLS
jgi:hypothetical protein